jgi:hypothetical protein
MSLAYDYNGTVVSPSEPKKSLRIVKKTVTIDSMDRDVAKFYTNGDFVISLPRVYENVISMRLVGAEFPPMIRNASPGAVIHLYKEGANTRTAIWSSDALVTVDSYQYYFLIDVEGLNKTDETALNANRSTFSDSFFAKIPAVTTAYGSQSFIEYNDHSLQENISTFSPPIGKLDRLHIRTRLHSQQDNSGFIYWTKDGAVASGTNQSGAGFNLTLEISMLDNGFDEFSSFETRIRNRG